MKLAISYVDDVLEKISLSRASESALDRFDFLGLLVEAVKLAQRDALRWSGPHLAVALYGLDAPGADTKKIATVLNSLAEVIT